MNRQKVNPYQVPTSVNGEASSRGVLRTAIAVFVLLVIIGIAFLSGLSWLQIVGCLQILGTGGAIYVSLFPFIVLMMLRRKEWTARLPHATLLAGVLLLIHVSLTAATIELMMRQPFFLDFVPYNGVLAETINIVVPCSLAGLAIAFFATNRSQKKLMVVACLVLIIANLSAICYGHYFFATLLGDGISAHVWWL